MHPAPNTRSQARTLALARAHADVTARHPRALAAVLGALLSVAIISGTASSGTATAADSSGAIVSLTQAPGENDATVDAVGLSFPLANIVADAEKARTGAQNALTAPCAAWSHSQAMNWY